jgi:predicted metal-dependent HD superfamily phosphohydrolase
MPNPDLTPTWHRTWSDLGATPPTTLLPQLLAAYAEPQRHYHSVQHLAECIAHLGPALHLAQRPGEVAIALWFHDAVYQLRSGDNEAQSAAWARRELMAAGVRADAYARVEALIMATRHDAQPTEPDARLLVDVDLAILGAPPQRFAEYEAQVQLEYAWVPKWLFKRKRRAVLRGFLARSPIYGTDHFRELLEVQARVNLAGAIG